MGLSTDEAQRLHNAGFKSYGQGRTSAPTRGGIAEIHHWTDGWLEAQGFAERQATLDLERKKISEETRYAFLAIDEEDGTAVTKPNWPTRANPNDVAHWAKAQGLTGWIIPVVGVMIVAPKLRPMRKVKPKITPKAAG